MSLCEAMANGTAVISTDCPTGPAEIIRGGIDGLLVENGDVTALGRAMQSLMNDPVRRSSLAANAAQITVRFGADRIFTQWDDILSSLLGTVVDSAG